jgi:hypothetical protein
MLKQVSRAAALVAVLATGAPVWAETPMSPLRRSAPPNAASDTAQQWVEPPAAPQRSTTENAAPVARPEESARPMRNPRQGPRVAKARGWSTRELNRRQLYGGWSGVSVPYYRGFGPAPYSNSGE